MYTEHGSNTLMHCAKLPNKWTIKQCVIGKRAFVKFEVKTHFGRIPCNETTSRGLIQYKICRLPSIGIPIVEITQSYDRLISEWDFLYWSDNIFILNQAQDSFLSAVEQVHSQWEEMFHMCSFLSLLQSGLQHAVNQHMIITMKMIKYEM